MNNEFLNFEDYYTEIETFKEHFLKFGPPGPKREIIMFEYLQSAICDAADYFT